MSRRAARTERSSRSDPLFPRQRRGVGRDNRTRHWSRRMVGDEQLREERCGRKARLELLGDIEVSLKRLAHPR